MTIVAAHRGHRASSTRSWLARALPPGLAAFAGALLALYTVDTTINLSLVQNLALGELVVVDWRDFLGLLQAEVPVALAAALASLIAEGALSLVPRARKDGHETLRALSAGLAALATLASCNSAWNLSSSQIPLALAIASLVGLLLWFALWRAARRRADASIRFHEVVQHAVFPPLLIGLASLALGKSYYGRYAEALVALACLAIGAGLVSVSVRSRSSAAKLAMALIPVATSVMLAIGSCFSATPRFTMTNVPAPDARPRPPDIVLIVLDTVRADHLQRYGYSRNTMPALEAWADTALTAKRAVSPAGWTTPAHASILSGRTVSLHGVHYGSGDGPFQTSPFHGIAWLPAQLAREGYYCLAVSANPLAIPRDVEGFEHVLAPLRQQWEGASIAALVERYARLHNPISEILRWRTPYSDALQTTDLVMRTVPEGNRPIFLFVNLLDAHSPYNPPRAALELLGVNPPRDIPRYLSHRELTQRWDSLPSDRLSSIRDLYDGELRWIDLQLDNLLSWLRRRFGPDVLIIITSDHGEELGEEGRVGHEYGLSQRLIHVPLFIRSRTLENGTLDPPLSLRRLYEFILLSARGRSPGAETLTHADEFGVIAERYASSANGRTLGRMYDRPWVALIENGIKGVGPSSQGFQLLDVESSGFGQEIATADSVMERVLRDRIDEYWRIYRDRRQESSASETPSEDDLLRLRSLGYVD